MSPSRPTLLVTTGEPAGIGPDILLLLAKRQLNARLVTIADPELLQQRSQLLGLDIKIEIYQDSHTPGTLQVVPVALKTRSIPGMPDRRNAGYVLQTLDLGIQYCRNGNFDALVTGPLSKSVINDLGISFMGHTEYLAERCGISLPVMMLANTQLRVALLTTHLPLERVVEEITSKRLEQVIRILHQDLGQKFAIENPSIAVCGLNPHAGENGYLGNQEKTLFKPVIEKLRHQGFQLSDPLPADTVFTASLRSNYDVILSMFHDQGLPAIKALGFGETVNITLGLPIIRTSVDHGTAFELAGSGKADPSSLLAAINQAIFMVKNQASAQSLTNN